MRGLFAIGVILINSAVQAGGLVAPFQFESTAVLPPGVRNARLQGASAEVSDKYVEGIGGMPIAFRMNRVLTYRDLVEAQATAIERASLTALVESEGRTLDSAVGDSHGVVNARVTTTVPLAAFGLTEKWTIAAVIPVIHTIVNVDTGWTANQDFTKLYNGLSEQGRHNQKESFKQKLHNVIQTKAIANNYEPVEGYTSTQLGDAILASKYKYYTDDWWTVTLTNRLVIPTGRQQDLNRLVDIPTGDGQWDLNMGVVAEYQSGPALVLGSSAYYTYQMPTTKAKRIPVKPLEAITPDIDAGTYEKQGDMMGASVYSKWKIEETLTFGAQYTYQYRRPDRYSGSKFAQERYDWMALETEQEMHSALIGLGYSTIPLFRKKQFPVPMEANLGWTRTLSGKNIMDMNMISTEVAVYF